MIAILDRVGIEGDRPRIHPFEAVSVASETPVEISGAVELFLGLKENKESPPLDKVAGSALLINFFRQIWPLNTKANHKF